MTKETLKRIFYISLIFFYILNITDGIVTFYGIEKFGFGAEGNDFLIYLVKNFGWEITFIFKVVGVIFTSLPLGIVVKKAKSFKYLIIPFTGLFFMIICFIIIIIDWLKVLL